MGPKSRAPRNTVGRQAFRFVLAISFAFVAVSSAVLFIVESRAKESVVEGELELLRASQVAGIAEGLWNLDIDMLQALADGIVNYPYFSRAVIEDDRGILAQGGETKEGSREIYFPAFKKRPGGAEFKVGALRVEIDSRKVFDDVLVQTLTTVALQVLLLVIESIIVLLFFSKMATRHLSRIAAYIIKNDVRPDAPPLRLDKKDRGDELDFLVKAYNRMRDDVAKSHNAESRAMEDLRLSEERSRILVEEAPDAIMMYDIEAGVFVDCNRRAEAVFGRTREELIGSSPIGWYVSEPEGEQAMRQSFDKAIAAASAGESVLVRRRVRRPGGESVDCEVRLNRLPAAGHKIIRESYLDVTERVRAEEAVVRSLREKEVLIQEVYHRTKNNMQLISSFLGLEAAASEDERVASALQDMIGRISSMALVHQKLYKSEDLSRIDLGDYVKDLVASVQSAYLEGRRGIAVSVRAEPDIVCVIDLAVPCGLILNELMVNCAKYAFADRESGNISVELRRSSPTTIELRVSDDGAGFPEGFDYRRDGHVGLQTVVSIVELQLRGSVSFSTGPAGTTCTAVMRDDLFGARI